MKRQVRVNGQKHTATAHYITNYGYIPLWILVKVLSFGIIGELFSILKYDDQKSICQLYDIPVEEFLVYLPILSNYRNLCAHEDILYENHTQKEIPNTKYHQILDIEQNENGYILGKNDLFALLIVMKQMLSYEEFKNMTLELASFVDNLDYNLHTITLDKILNRMGFPKNWKQLMNIERERYNEEK